MRYAVEQRLRFIDFLLMQYGHINRSAIMNYFGVSMPQASNDIREYITVAPDNLVYLPAAKHYSRTPTFKSAFENEP